MSFLTSTDVLRPAKGGVAGLLQKALFAAMPWVFSVLRRAKPVVTFGPMVLTSRYDDVRAVFADDKSFGVVYQPKLDVIMGGQPFFLGMADTAQYREDTAAMRTVVRPSDLPRLSADVEARAEAIVAAANGRIEVVDDLVRRVTSIFWPTISACRPFRRARAIYASGRRGCSNSSSPTRATIRAYAPRSMRSRQPCAPISTRRLPRVKSCRRRTMSWGGATSCSGRATPGSTMSASARR